MNARPDEIGVAATEREGNHFTGFLSSNLKWKSCYQILDTPV